MSTSPTGQFITQGVPYSIINYNDIGIKAVFIALFLLILRMGGRPCTHICSILVCEKNCDIA